MAQDTKPEKHRAKSGLSGDASRRDSEGIGDTMDVANNTSQASEAEKDTMLRERERAGRIRVHIDAAEKRMMKNARLTRQLSLLIGGVVTCCLIAIFLVLRGDVRNLEESFAVFEDLEASRAGELGQLIEGAVRSAAPGLINGVLGDSVSIETMTDGDSQIVDKEASVTVRGNLIGAARGADGRPLRVVMGTTDPVTMDWMTDTPGGIYTDIDTSVGDFEETPQYFTSLSGVMGHHLARGVTSIYRPTSKGFRVYISLAGLTPEKARRWDWAISWVAVGS